MHTTTKGALAAGAAAVLLLGGASSLAYWNDVDTIGAGTITAGNLDIDASSCAANTTWTVTNTLENVTNQPFNITSDKVVPGDVLTKSCTVSIIAVGKDLRAKLAVTGGGTGTAATTMASADYTVGSTFTLGGQPIGTITSANTGQSIQATITVGFPIRAGVFNDSKLKDLRLDAFTVTATQATTNP